MKKTEDIMVSDIKNMDSVLLGIDAASILSTFPDTDLKFKDDSDFKLGYKIGKKYANKPCLKLVNDMKDKYKKM